MTVRHIERTSEITVAYINMTGIDFPEVGKTADREPVSAAPNYYDCKNITWYEDGKYMDYDDTFKEGKEYTVEMYIDTIRSGWDYTAKFAENISATVDGFAVKTGDIKRFHDTSVAITYTFPALEEEKPVETDKPSETEKSEETEKEIFVDVAKDKYYYEPVMWAYENGITSGTGKNTFGPEDACTRGQVVTFLWRAAGCPEPKSSNNPFSDVKSDDYYYKAVLWAVEEGITAGTSANEFSPKATCSSAHIITFLYRAVDAGIDGWYKEAREWALV